MPDSPRTVRAFQRASNRFNARMHLHYKALAVDGQKGPQTRVAIKKSRHHVGVGRGDWRKNSTDITVELLKTLRDPFRRVKGYSRATNWRRRVLASRRRKDRIRRWKAARKSRRRLRGTSAGAPHWGGARYVVEATRPIAARYGNPVTSTKRWPPIGGNYGSWHNTTQKTAWADDYATFNGAGHAQAIRSYWGNRARASGTYALYTVKVEGRYFRKQTLWAVLGHHNHVHDGASR